MEKAVIEPNCSRRDTPECKTCARRGEGDYYAIVHKHHKNGREVWCRCLSYREKR